MNGKYPRYLTFKPGELETAVAGLGAAPEAAQVLRSGSSGGSALVKSHASLVRFPDGTEGRCSYTRCGPGWHLLRYEHTGRDGRRIPLPTRYLTVRIGNSLSAIEKTAQEHAEAAFAAGILREQKDWFCRAVSPTWSKPEAKPQMKAVKAKELAGRYALCQRVGNTLLPVSETFETMEAASLAWQGQANKSLVIACCCRFRRRWEEPRLNPLHAHPDYPELLSSFPPPPQGSALPHSLEAEAWEDGLDGLDGLDEASEEHEL